MFTGLVETTGILRRRRAGKKVARAFIETRLGPLVLGESVNVNGACLTVDRILEGEGFEADLSSETLAATTLGGLRLGSRVHLERATPLGGRMGGHMVLGHVDGVGRVQGAEAVGDATRFVVRASGELARFLAPKGSIALDGVSLTLNGVSGGPGLPGEEVVFDVMLVPHTKSRTILHELAKGAPINIEVDVLARYVARQLELGVRPAPSASDGEALSPAGPAEPTKKEGSNADRDERILSKLRTSGYF